MTLLKGSRTDIKNPATQNGPDGYISYLSSTIHFDNKIWYTKNLTNETRPFR